MNSCYLTLHLLHSYVFWSVLRLGCILLFNLFWFICFGESRKMNVWKSPAFHEGRTLAVFNGSFPLIWMLLWRTLPVRPARDCPHCFCKGEGRCSRYGSALSLRNICWELTHLFWINILPSSDSFRSSISLRKFIEVKFFIFSIGKVLIT